MSGMNMGTRTASSPTSDPMTDSLKTMSGKEFEIKFMQYMIVHHQFAIQMAQLVATHTNRPELKTMANSIRTVCMRCHQLCQDRKSTCLNSSHTVISYAVFCLKKKKKRI